MTNEQRQKLADWCTWYRANRPRHEGAADVQQTQKFILKSLEGVYSILILMAENERTSNGLVVLPHLERR
jgi:hypothetical protein